MPPLAARASARPVLDTLFWIGLILTAWCAYFFRDPDASRRSTTDLVVSPADGVISAVGPAVPPSELGLGNVEMTRVSVFMDVFSCHVNRAPVRGRIVKIEHRAGKFLNAELDKASSENERNGWSSTAPTARSSPCRSLGLWPAASSAGPRPAPISALASVSG